MLNFRVCPCLSSELEEFGESDSGAAGPRATRTRPGHSSSSGQESPEIRGGHQPGRRTERSRRCWALSTYPDVVLQSLDRGHKLQAVVEVETGESVNHLEALA